MICISATCFLHTNSIHASANASCTERVWWCCWYTCISVTQTTCITYPNNLRPKGFRYTVSIFIWCYSHSITTDPLAEKALDVLRTDRIANSLWTHDKKHKSLNEDQKKAIKYALTNCFQLIQGPPGQYSKSSLFTYIMLHTYSPSTCSCLTIFFFSQILLMFTGTGKSETGAHIAYIFARVLKQLRKKNQCVIYCAPSNKAVDVVHGKRCDKLWYFHVWFCSEKIEATWSSVFNTFAKMLATAAMWESWGSNDYVVLNSYNIHILPAINCTIFASSYNYSRKTAWCKLGSITFSLREVKVATTVWENTWENGLPWSLHLSWLPWAIWWRRKMSGWVQGSFSAPSHSKKLLWVEENGKNVQEDGEREYSTNTWDAYGVSNTHQQKGKRDNWPGVWYYSRYL